MVPYNEEMLHYNCGLLSPEFRRATFAWKDGAVGGLVNIPEVTLMVRSWVDLYSVTRWFSQDSLDITGDISLASTIF